ncbi:Uncharacterised protein [Mycobacteroides abscessus subsp. abscessus]|nr:Uncharacterised protein [Mycobacteroides abscessus subsp. abscessus]
MLSSIWFMIPAMVLCIVNNEPCMVFMIAIIGGNSASTRGIRTSILSTFTTMPSMSSVI